MANNPLKIYVAGPYTDTTEAKMLKNVTVVIDTAIEIFRKGHFPYVPHLTHFVDNRTKELGVSLTWSHYMRWHDEWLAVCDAFLYTKSSRGSDLELKKAQELGKKIFYSLEEIPTVCKPKIKRHLR